MFSNLNEVAEFFSTHLFEFTRAEAGQVEVHGVTYELSCLPPSMYDSQTICKFSYFDNAVNEEGKYDEYVLMYTNAGNLMVSTGEGDVEVYSFMDIINDGLFGLSLVSLSKFHHITNAMIELDKSQN